MLVVARLSCLNYKLVALARGVYGLARYKKLPSGAEKALVVPSSAP